MRGRLVLAVLVLALAIPSCGRGGRDTPPAPGDPGGVSPTGSPPGVRVDLATDDLLAAMRDGLDAWAERWRAAAPGFALDSLYRDAAQPFHPQLTRPLTTQDVQRARFFGAVSPDSSRIAEADWYRQVIDGEPELWGEPDAAPALVDLKADSFHVLTTIGTVGGFEEVFWIDRERFVVIGYAERRFEPWSGGGDLWVYDLARGTLTTFHTPDVGREAYERYLDLARPALRKKYDVRLRA